MSANRFPGRFGKITFDSRQVGEGDVFVGVHGERDYGGKYWREALERGAIFLVLEEDEILSSVELPRSSVVVKSARSYLGELAKEKRKRWEGTVVGITGTFAKTSVRSALQKVLSSAGYRVGGSYGNYNSTLGLPKVMLEAPDDAEVYVFELGVNGPGEMDFLLSVLEPHIGVLTGLGVAHTAHFTSEEDYRREKLKILAGRRGLYRHVVPLEVGEERYHPFSMCFGDLRGVFANGELLVEWSGGAGRVEVVPPSKLWADNVFFAIAVAKFAELLRPFEPFACRLEGGGRLEEFRVGDVVVVNDAYNANPDSTLAAVRDFVERFGRENSVAVLGDMLELKDEVEEHRRCGEAVLRMCDAVFVGERYASAGFPVVPRERLMAKLFALLEEGKRNFIFKSSHRTGLMETAREFLRRLRER